jgi:DNA-binding Xre family transcriptional regulator
VLKEHRLTYADIAKRLKMSEANVKRMFATKRFTLQRLAQVCQLMDMELTDLFQCYEASRQSISHLTEDQENELVSDAKLLLVAVCVRNHFGFEDITERYKISPTECIRYLAKLDKLKIIDLLPSNRIKLRIDEGFRWLPKGPIELFFEKQVQSQFLKSSFGAEGDQRLFMSGLLSDRSRQVILNKMQLLAKEFVDLHRQDAKLPLDKRDNIGLLMAMREWEFEVFKPLRKK